MQIGVQKSYWLGAALTAFTLAFHFLPIWVTMLNRGPTGWDGEPLPYDEIESVIALHSEGGDPAFARRPVTTWCIRALTRAGISPKTAFISVGLLGLYAAGLLVFRLALRSGQPPGSALWSQAMFHLSPTVLMAWFVPMYSYDEPLQYVALLVALWCVSGSRWIAFALVFALAMVVRETSLLLVPAFVLIAPHPGRATLGSVGALALFACWLWFTSTGSMFTMHSADVMRRMGVVEKNLDPAHLGETIGFVLLVLLLPVFLLFRQPALIRGRWRAAFAVTLVLNTLVVLFLALAREARLFALPLLLVWPLLGPALLAEAKAHGGWHRWMVSCFRPWRVLALAVIMVAAAWLGYRYFQLTSSWQEDNLFHEMLFAHVAFIAACLLVPGREQADTMATNNVLAQTPPPSVAAKKT